MRMVSFRFDAVRVTLGGALLSVGAGVTELVGDLRLVGGVLFVLGVVVTTAGLVRIAERRVVIHDQWSTRRVIEALKRAPPDATVRILQTWFPEEEFADCLCDLLVHEGKRFDLQVLLLRAHDARSRKSDLLSARVRLRGTDRSKAIREIGETLDMLVNLKRSVDEVWRAQGADGRKPKVLDLEVRLYEFMPFGPIYQIGGDVMFVGFFLNYDTSAAGPMLEVRKADQHRIWRKFEQDFERGWRDAAPYFPHRAEA
jgi:hypothetical protein